MDKQTDLAAIAVSDSASAELLAAAAMPMPFGKFKGTRLIDLPEPYVVWFKGQGWPSGKLGQRMGLIYEIKLNGLEKLIRPLLDAQSSTQEKQPQG